MNKLLLIGQFPEPITGEAICNQHISELLHSKGVCHKCINSSLIENVDDVGSFSLMKMFKAIYVIFESILNLFRFDSVYITPGQSLFGLIRFFPVVFLSVLFKKKLVLHWHGYGVKFLSEKFPNLTKMFFSPSIKNLVLTNDLKVTLKAKYPKSNLNVVENFSGLEITKSINGDKEKLQVIYLGGLMEEKGISEFIEVAKKNRNFEFVVCGRGGQQIEKELTNLNNQGVLSYRGSVKGEDKKKAFRDSDIFVLQSNYRTEGVPLTIIEAMSQGCAILTTRHNGIPETVVDSAIFIEKNSSKSLSTSLHNLHNNRDLLKSLKEKSILRSRYFSKENFELRILSVLGVNSEY